MATAVDGGNTPLLIRLGWSRRAASRRPVPLRLMDWKEVYEQGDPAGRAAFLERVCATHVVLPAFRPAAHWVLAFLRHRLASLAPTVLPES